MQTRALWPLIDDHSGHSLEEDHLNCVTNKEGKHNYHEQ